MSTTTRRTSRDLAVDAGTAMVLVTLVWGGAWTLLMRGWQASTGVLALAILTVVMDRLVRRVLRRF